MPLENKTHLFSHWSTVQLAVKGSSLLFWVRRLGGTVATDGGSLEAVELKNKRPQLRTDGAAEAQNLMIKRVLMWSELVLGAFMWSRSEPFAQSMEVIWVHLGVQTGYIENIQRLAACGDVLALPAIADMQTFPHYALTRRERKQNYSRRRKRWLGEM